MRVYIGPYKHWWGPYQIADLLQKVGVSEERCEKIGDWLASTKFSVLCQNVYESRGRTVKVKIHDYDVWSMDSTLGLIILPMLKKIKENKQGSPMVDDEDVPLNLRSTVAPLTKAQVAQGHTDKHFHDRWDWVLNEMIWAFSEDQTDWESQFCSGVHDKVFTPLDAQGNPTTEDKATTHRWDDGPNHTFKVDWEARAKHAERMQNGFRLFGKYYSSLWT